MVQAESIPPRKTTVPTLSDFPDYNPPVYELGYREATLNSRGSKGTVSLPPPSNVALAEAIADTLQSYSITGASNFALVYREDDGSSNVVTSANLQTRLGDAFYTSLISNLETLFTGRRPTYNTKIQASSRGSKDGRRYREAVRAGVASRRGPASRTGMGLTRHRKRRAPASRQMEPQQQDESDSRDCEEDEESCVQSPQTVRTERIKVGDKHACAEFYRLRFENIQQLACKQIAKDWIKAIEPKKQTTFPYNGGKAAKIERERYEREGKPWPQDAGLEGECTRPPWWPEDVIHKEPDHIGKKERITLMQHLLTELYDPPHNLRVETLRQSTKRTVAQFAEYKTGPGADCLTKWLNEIYQLREEQEKVKDGAIDEITTLTFPALILKPRRSPKKKHSQKQSFAQQYHMSPEVSEIEESEDESPINLTSPVGRMDLDDSPSMARRIAYNGNGHPHLDQSSQPFYRCGNSMPSLLSPSTDLSYQDDIQPVKTPLSAPVNFGYSHNQMPEQNVSFTMQSLPQSNFHGKARSESLPALHAMPQVTHLREFPPGNVYTDTQTHVNTTNQDTMQVCSTGAASDDQNGQYTDFWEGSAGGYGTQVNDDMLEYMNASCSTSNMCQSQMGLPILNSGQAMGMFSGDSRPVSEALRLPTQPVFPTQPITVPAGQFAHGMPMPVPVDHRHLGYSMQKA